MKSIGLRALHSLLLLVGASVLSILLVRLAPGDYFESMRINPQISNRTIAALRSQYGLDKPLPVLYWHWAQSALKGEGGFSFAYNSAAGPILWPRAQNTLLLAGCATLLAWMIALPAGVLAAARRGSWADLLASGTIALLLAIPELVLGLVLLLFAVHTGFPAGGMISAARAEAGFWDKSRDVIRHLFMPAVCLAAGLLPLLLSHVRAAMEEALRSPFILAARGFGISFRRVLLRHALPAALNPIISLFGLSVGLLMSSSLLVEAIFGWPGLGKLMLQAIADRDLFLVIDSTMLGTGFLIAGNFVADILLYLCDPRIRAD
ncbi:MAG TPA: ABC transporter permease [Bryobacteraceae bacterium]|jgi:peptide/nickel transport system permease protein